jgi:PhnB protein
MDRHADTTAAPPGYSRIDPWVISRDTDAEIRFLHGVFGAVERPGSRMVNTDGTIGHVEVELGDSVVLMFDAQPDWPPLPAHLRIYSYVTAAVGRAVEAGAREITRPTVLAFGERVARIRDPQGHLWWIHERFEEVDLAEMTRRFAEPGYQSAMDYVQQSFAEEMSDWSRQRAAAE